jgi:hypothetical protein
MKKKKKKKGKYIQKLQQENTRISQDEDHAVIP